MRVCSILLVRIWRLCSSGGRGLWLAKDEPVPADELVELTLAAAADKHEEEAVAWAPALAPIPDTEAAIASIRWWTYFLFLFFT